MGGPSQTITRSDRARGLLLLLCAAVLFLSLFSHSPQHEGNWLGLIGNLLSKVLLYSIGLGAYLIATALAWSGWIKFRGRTTHPYWILQWVGLVISFCLGATILVDNWPKLGLWLYPFIYTDALTHVAPVAFREIRFHLGGVIFTELYSGLPYLNLRQLLSPIGTSLFSAGTASICLTLLADIRPIAWLQQIVKQLLRQVRKKHQSVVVPPSFPATQPARPPIVSEPLESESFLSEPPPPPKPRPALPAPMPVPKAIGIYKGYQLPPLTLLTQATKIDQTILRKGLRQQADTLEGTLASFGIQGKVGDIHCGPTITSFEVHPPVGVKVQKIQALEKDLALNLRAGSIRLLAPIPGKAAVGVEIPNPRAQEVGLREMLESYQAKGSTCRIPLLIGKAVNGEDLFADLVQMPHLLIAGATGSGKSVCLNTLIVTILMTARPDQVKLLMVDPKKVELSAYSELPHMVAPVITEPKEACIALHWLVREMERRYEILRRLGLRNIEAFNNRKIDTLVEAELEMEIPQHFSYIVAIIDELADLMMVSSSDIETPITRIAQMARAVGIHMVLATQRPSREVLTGLIKANFPTRLAFKVSSRVNSQIILDEPGAEALLGNGDLLFRPPGTHHLLRAQGPYVRDSDINGVIDCIRRQAHTDYQIASFLEREDLLTESPSLQGGEERDELYEKAYELITSTGVASTTFLQRKLKVGYARAASIMDQLEANGVIGPADGSKARELLVGPQHL